MEFLLEALGEFLWDLFKNLCAALLINKFHAWRVQPA